MCLRTNRAILLPLPAQRVKGFRAVKNFIKPCTSPPEQKRLQRHSRDTLEKANHDARILGGRERALAEIMLAIQSGDLEAFLADWGIQFITISRASAIIAGGMYRNYVFGKGAAKRVLPDFLIGAHAMQHADRLIARDGGFYRDYFSDLELLEPHFST